MQIKSFVKSNTLFLQLFGEMDEYTAQKARVECDRLIDSMSFVQKIVIDLSEIKFMDSTGIGFLIGRYKKASRLNIALYVANPNFAADKILSLSGIYSIIPKCG